MKKFFKSKTFLGAVMSIALCLSLIAGATFAIFTSEANVNISVGTATVKVTAEIDEDSVETKSLNNAYASGAGNMYEATATFGSEGLVLNKMLPGDGIKFNIEVRNESDVTIKFRTIVGCAEDDGLYDGLMVKLNNVEYDGVTAVDNYATLAVGEGNKTVPVEIVLPDAAGSEYGNKKCTIVYKVEAIQGNAATETPVEGDLYISTVNDLIKFRDSVNAATGAKTYKNKTVRLINDIDLSGIAWQPVGIKNQTRFQGTFDGQGHTIKNVNIVYGRPSGTSYYGGGFFCDTAGATIKNVTFENVSVNSGVCREGTDILLGNIYGVVCGYAYGDSTFENITVKNSKVEAFGKVGAILGYAAETNATYTFTDCNVINTEVVGVYNLGGLFGTLNSAKLVVENCDVSGVNFTKASTAYSGASLVKQVTKTLLGREMTFATTEAEDYFCVFAAKYGTLLIEDDGMLGHEIAYDDETHIATVYDTFENASGIATGAGETNEEKVFDGKNKVIVKNWLDAWVGANLTVQNVLFSNGAVFNVGADNVTINLEGCTFVACNQVRAAKTLGITGTEGQGNGSRNNVLVNTGAGMCLDLETREHTGITFNVKNCVSLGENDWTTARAGYKYSRDGKVESTNKARGHGIVLNAIEGNAVNTSYALNIEGCEISGVRGNAIQLYGGNAGNINIKNTKIFSWGMNSSTEKDDAAIRGDYTTGNKSIVLENVYFGMNENKYDVTAKKLIHINVGNYEGNTVGSAEGATIPDRIAGTYSFSDKA